MPPSLYRFSYPLSQPHRVPPPPPLPPPPLPLVHSSHRPLPPDLLLPYLNELNPFNSKSAGSPLLTHMPLTHPVRTQLSDYLYHNFRTLHPERNLSRPTAPHLIDASMRFLATHYRPEFTRATLEHRTLWPKLEAKHFYSSPYSKEGSRFYSDERAHIAELMRHAVSTGSMDHASHPYTLDYTGTATPGLSGLTTDPRLIRLASDHTGILHNQQRGTPHTRVSMQYNRPSSLEDYSVRNHFPASFITAFPVDSHQGESYPYSLTIAPPYMPSL